jgi:hypothetical protein
MFDNGKTIKRALRVGIDLNQCGQVYLRVTASAFKKLIPTAHKQKQAGRKRDVAFMFLNVDDQIETCLPRFFL